MPAEVYFGSARQRQLRRDETLPAKLDRIIDLLHIRDRVKGELVAVKMHLGSHIGYSTIHPLFVRKVVQAVKDGGGQPFVTDTPNAVLTAYERGYTPETLGCPILPAAGVRETYYRTTHDPYKSIDTWKIAGQVADATFLIDFAHAKGHPACSYGGVFKNLALGCLIGELRHQLHDLCHYDQYWFPELCPDPAVRTAIIASCPQKAIVPDKENPDGLHLHFDQCNGCERCLTVAPAGSWKIQPENFASFQMGMAMSTKQTLRTFAKEKQVFLNLATQITPVCDCFGMTTISILPDVGIFGGNDICAIEQATLDALGKLQLIEENVPESFTVQKELPHPLQQLHGKHKDPYLIVKYGVELGLGTNEYTLLDVMEQTTAAPGESHISAAHM